MDYASITLETTDAVAVITLNRPDKYNALTAQMRAEIPHAVRAAAKEARVIVLTGAGKAFCSGQDLGGNSNAATADLERVLREEYGPMINTIAECPVPTIAAVNGVAAGAGANLALAADVVIAAESAYFLQAFARIGLMPDAGGTWTMPRHMGLAKSMGAALFADKISARQADAWGMIWEAVEDTAFEALWRARAMHLAQGPTEAYQAIKTALRQSFEQSLEQQMNLEAQLQGRCGATRDFQEGVVAFVEKRAANFEGR